MTDVKRLYLDILTKEYLYDAYISRGLSRPQIAKECGVNATTVYEYLIYHEIIGKRMHGLSNNYDTRFIQKLAYNDYKLKKKCEICGSKDKINIHHKDKNRYNNCLENLMILCSVCHGRLHNCDGGINGYVRKTCKICDEPAKSMGYCNAHYKRMRKHGNPYMVIVWIDNKRTLVDEREVKHMKYINHTDGKMIE